MTKNFDQEPAGFRLKVREVLDEVVSPHIETWELGRSFPTHKVFEQLGAAGLLGLEYPKEIGGGGLDHFHTVVFAEELGRLCCNGIASSIAIQTDMATPALAHFGSPELRERFLAPALRGEVVAAVAVTEPGAGSDVAALATRAERDGDQWCITGRKRYITNGGDADWVCLLARTSDEGRTRGMSLIVVPTATQGFTVVDRPRKLGGRAVDTVELEFDQCRVPVANTIGEIGRGFQQQMQQFEVERMVANYVAVGEATVALERTLEFVAQRELFKHTLIESQYVQFTLCELLAELDLLRQYNYECARAYVAGKNVARQATIAKLTAGRLQRKVADRCIQFHGGAGYMDDGWVSRYFRDSRLLSIGGGADEVMLRILGRLEGMPVVF